MKRNNRRPSKRKLTGEALKRVRRAAMAQSYYMRSNELLVTTEEREDGTCCSTAEVLPSTAVPNVMSIVVGTDAECTAHALHMSDMAEACNLRFTEVFIRRDAS